jgi:DNA-binding transcriptional ArsR family regulator
MADVFKALSDPTRREILRLLQAGDMTAGAIAENFAISKPSISHHLSALKAADLVVAERHGQEIVYSLNTTVFQDIIGFAMQFLGERTDGETGGRR